MSTANVVHLSFADRAPGSPEQISRIRQMLHGRSLALYGDDDLLARLSTEDDADAAFEFSLREDMGSELRHGWIWVAGSLGHAEAIGQMDIVVQIRALSNGGARAASMKRTCEAWSEASKRLASTAEQGREHELDTMLLAGMSEFDAFPEHPMAGAE